MNRFTQYILVLLSFPLIAGTAVAQQVNPMLSEGTRELSLSGNLEFPEFEEIDFDINASYGYFISDGWEVGGQVVGADIAGIERFDVGIFTEYNFNRGSNMVPFVGASVGIATASFDSDFDLDTTLGVDDEEATVFSFSGGIKWFVRDYMAVSTSIGFNVSTDDIYAADDELADNLTRFKIGLRYYF